MAAPNPTQGPEFPAWPYNCLSLYTHMARDFGRYAQAMTKSTDVMQTARAEGDFGARLFSDLMQGYFDLALAPWTAMAAAMAQQGQDAGVTTPAADVQPKRSRARSR